MRLVLRRATRAALAGGALLALAAPAWRGARGLRRRWLTVEVAGESMVPALEPGDWLVARRGAAAVPAGAIALARDPSGRLLLKRVIGLPGETIELRDGRVHIDGRALLESYCRGETDPSSEFRTLTRLDVGAYYLLGDNRRASTDSRDHGAFRLDAEAGKASVEGLAVLRYWPARRFGRLRPAPRTFEEASAG